MLSGCKELTGTSDLQYDHNLTSPLRFQWLLTILLELIRRIPNPFHPLPGTNGHTYKPKLGKIIGLNDDVSEKY